MNELYEMLNTIEKYLNKKLDPETFSYDFPDLVREGKFHGYDDTLLEAIGDVSEACGLYEPHPGIREDYSGWYYDEKELYDIVEKNYKIMTKYKD
ncbi:hypothetical protein [Ornithinibacillus xuwenensis]|uniref:Uncharacterized protein n=1 Tax=Ornithinibacillus xuwenensis TaxID=3144668 RepID=A0ABU9XC32_9BACI